MEEILKQKHLMEDGDAEADARVTAIAHLYFGKGRLNIDLTMLARIRLV